MSADERRLQAWLRLWAPIFLVGGVLFYGLPGATTAAMNRSARGVGLAPSQVDDSNLWVVLAGAYMALITVIAQRASQAPLQRKELVRLLVLGKAASSLGALGYFVFKRRAYAFLLNFVLDGAICAGTEYLLERAEAKG
jgi:hypothetical protein